MTNKTKNRKLTIIVLTICIPICFLLFPFFFSISKYLSETEKVDANLLIVEGWLDPYAIKKAADEIKKNKYEYILTTGIYIPGYYQIYSPGYLIFYTKKLEGLNKVDKHIIEIDAYSELEGNNCAHFKVYINDSIVANFNADKKRRKYKVTWGGSLEKIDSILINFDNDLVGDFGDRNLYVKEIIIDHNIHIPYQFNSVYDIDELDNKVRLINSFSSYAELAKTRILKYGIDSSQVVAITGKRVFLNRTLSSALAFRDWLNKSNIKVKGINILTIGTHAKRTFMTYHKILHDKYKIGIISLPDKKEINSKSYMTFKTLHEIIGIIYYWIILIPY